MAYKEIETKYDAEDIKLKDFTNLLESSFNANKKIVVSSYDYYFTKSQDKFIRFRSGEKPELTVKVKQNQKDNIFRTEVNIKIDHSMNLEDVKMFCSILGYELNFLIFKVCHIYFFDDANVVYYSVFDENLKEKRKFIEIEINENLNISEEAAWLKLQNYEKKLESLGILPQSRMRKSLYEIFKKS